MQLGIFAKTFPGNSPDIVLAAARRAGYRTVQYNMACSGLPSLPAAIDAAVADAVRAASEAEGVGIAALSATYNMVHPDAAIRAAGRRSLAALAAAAPLMGTRLLTLCTGSRDAADQWRRHPDNDTPEAWQAMVAEFRAILPIAEAHDVMLGIEPELGNVVSSAAKARALIDLLGGERIRIVLDPANLFEVAPPERQRQLVDEAIALVGDHVALAHAKDRRPDGGFAAAGDGIIDFEHVIAALAGAGFDGPLVTHGLEAGDARRVAAHLRAAGGGRIAA